MTHTLPTADVIVDCMIAAGLAAAGNYDAGRHHLVARLERAREVGGCEAPEATDLVHQYENALAGFQRRHSGGADRRHV
jgi:hypothetical protein